MPASTTPESAIFSRTASDAECSTCERLLGAMNSTFQAVHDFIIQNRDQRSVNESYLGDLGRLIQAQVVAHRELCKHQRTH